MQIFSFFKRMLAVLALSLLAHVALAQQTNSSTEPKTLYVFGVVYHFADSTAYISELQMLTLPTYKNGQVAVQDVLSERFKRYVKQTYDVTHSVSALFVETTKAKAEKQLVKVRKQYIKKNGEHKWLPVTLERFRFINTTLEN
ncbi:MAG: hypothetical protein Q4A44_04545 [Bacteroidales bacterium]|nr:hypothetical protein [Bacteroidales bacterium]